MTNINYSILEGNDTLTENQLAELNTEFEILQDRELEGIDLDIENMEICERIRLGIDEI